MKPQWICSYLPYGPLWKCDPQDEVCILIITTTLYYTQAHTGNVSGSFSAHTMHLFLSNTPSLMIPLQSLCIWINSLSSCEALFYESLYQIPYFIACKAFIAVYRLNLCSAGVSIMPNKKTTKGTTAIPHCRSIQCQFIVIPRSNQGHAKVKIKATDRPHKVTLRSDECDYLIRTIPQ